jgi:hypothetical protein
MTPEEINEAIALSLGYTHERVQLKMEVDKWKAADGRVHYFALPDYYRSLDACREFESMFPVFSGSEMADYWRSGRGAYVELLYDIASGEKFDPDCGALYEYLVYATAPQRCEAYLKLKGLWKEDK